MGIFSVLRDGSGSNRLARVTPEGALLSISVPAPAFGSGQPMIAYREFLENSAGSSDMAVDGSTTPVEFFVSAEVDDDIYIKGLAITVADAGAVLRQFGSLSALTNGILLRFIDEEGTEVTLHDGIKSNFDLIQAGAFDPAYGDAASAFRASNVVSTSEAFFTFLDFSRVYGFPFGLKLQHDSTQRLSMLIQDDVSGVDRLDAVATGFRRLGR